MTLMLHSEAFERGQPIPKHYTADGRDISPPLRWRGVPEEAKELALICDDPDAPTEEPWVHWVIYKLPPDTKSLPEGVPTLQRMDIPVAAYQGVNSWTSGQATGYRGPAPPEGHGVHHYRFKLYALDIELDVKPGLTKKALLRLITGHILAEAEVVGTYER